MIPSFYFSGKTNHENRITTFIHKYSNFCSKNCFKGTLLDKESKNPIVYANISFLKQKKGISSTEDGTFELEITKKDLDKKVHVSCLNYKDTIVLVKDLMNKTLYLSPNLYELKEIVISKKLSKEVVVDKYKRKNIKTSFGARKGSPWIITKLFKYKESYEETPYVKDVTVYFGSWMMRKKGKFRVRIYSVDEITKKPKDDLIRDNIIVEVRKNHGKIKVDISKYNIEVPEEGFYVGVERLEIPYNFHEYTYTMQGSKKKRKAIAVAPSIGAVYTTDSIYIYSRGKWRQFFAPKQFQKGYNIQPAISVTLSN
ncbi:MAG: carboxypeptidase-like regulatory domain-containing protein [Flavobacteriaceae bacterium]|nr:carboxypeptidase-like regulatory domain-containing protein [Flavobacteriaceae bacterium]